MKTGRKYEVKKSILNNVVSASGWTFSLTADSTYDWKQIKWTISIGVFAAKVPNIGSQLVQFQIGQRHYFEQTDSDPEGWGLRGDCVYVPEIKPSYQFAV